MNEVGRTILVTGATGTVGSEVVKQLVSSFSSSSGQSIIRAAVHSQNNAVVVQQEKVDRVGFEPRTSASFF
jgi:uncharacterized protein YbjT (DUF2867 family)